MKNHVSFYQDTKQQIVKVDHLMKASLHHRQLRPSDLRTSAQLLGLTKRFFHFGGHLLKGRLRCSLQAAIGKWGERELFISLRPRSRFAAIQYYGGQRLTYMWNMYFCLMGFKDSKLYQMLWVKCPKCHEGDMFEESNPYVLGKLTKMHKTCPTCGADFVKEPGFYFGAAYVSYALTVALWVAVLVAMYTFDALGWITFSFLENPWTFISTAIATLMLSLPYVYRLSRSIWIGIFVGKDSEI